MKLDLIALFNSDFNATPDDTAWRAGVTLWGKAWHQVPAGSLPNDDATLCNLAGLGRDLKTWRRVKGAALRGFQECSDGRIYHAYVCKMAVEADEERRKFERRKAADRERKKGPNSEGSAPGIPPEIKPHSIGKNTEIAVEGQGQGQGQGQAPVGPQADLDEIKASIRTAVRWDTDPANLAGVGGWLDSMISEGADPRKDVLATVQRVMASKPPSFVPRHMGYFGDAVRQQMQQRIRVRGTVPEPEAERQLPELTNPTERRMRIAYLVWLKSGHWDNDAEMDFGPAPGTLGSRFTADLLTRFGLAEQQGRAA